MKKTLGREVIACDYCGSVMGDVEFPIFRSPCCVCGKDICGEHSAKIYYRNCEEDGVLICREHLPEEVFKEEIE